MERLRNPHPGDTIRDELEERGLRAYKLAQAIGMQETALVLKQANAVDVFGCRSRAMPGDSFPGLPALAVA